MQKLLNQLFWIYMAIPRTAEFSSLRAVVQMIHYKCTLLPDCEGSQQRVQAFIQKCRVQLILEGLDIDELAKTAMQRNGYTGYGQMQPVLDIWDR